MEGFLDGFYTGPGLRRDKLRPGLRMTLASV